MSPGRDSQAGYTTHHSRITKTVTTTIEDLAMTQRFARRALTATIGGIVAAALILPAPAATEVNVGYAIPSDSHYREGFRAFKDALGPRSGGAVNASDRPRGPLGRQRARSEGP